MISRDYSYGDRLTIQEAAREFDVSPGWLRRQVSRGLIAGSWQDTARPIRFQQGDVIRAMYRGQKKLGKHAR